MLLNRLLEITKFQDENLYKDIEYYGNNISTKILLIYRKFLQENKSIVLITHSKKEAETFQEKLLYFTQDVFIYPEIDILKRFANKSNDLENISLNILANLKNNKKMILILTASSLFRTIKNPKEFFNNNLSISLDNYIEFSNFPKLLINMGYKKSYIVENIGDFSVRGSIIDIYSPLQNKPIRLDFFDEDLDTIKEFDLETQKSEKEIKSVNIYPTSDFFLTQQEKEKIVDVLSKELNNKKLEDLDNFKDIKYYLENKINLFKESSIFDGLESFSNYIYDDVVYSIYDYLDNNIIIYDNFLKIKEKINSLKEYFTVNFSEISDNYIFQNIIDYEGFNKFLNSKANKIYLSTLKSRENFIDKYYNISVQDLAYFSNSDYLISELREKLKNKYEIVIAIKNEKQKEYIEKVLIENNLIDEVFLGIKAGKIHIEKTNYDLKGFESEKNKFLLITPTEIFRENVKKKKRLSFKYTNSEKIRNYQELNIGDYIVHIHHGIGIYQGIENIEVNGINKDYLKVVYDGGDKIYVDIENMKYIQKYTSSADDKNPLLNKLGTKKWNQVKNRVKKEIEDISDELIKLYIARELNKGYAFSQDGLMQKEFENNFMFNATHDQEIATAEIKKDMEKSRPMDRLLCGDVGFGKTEVAMRVAFKAIMDNKQVAVLVPTTLLANQHYETFVDRFSNFPINIEVVTRFTSQNKINEISKKLLSGNVDIIIGTHKLLNDKFKYKDLGLLVIDEEQRFGVKHKEKIKHIKNTIDVLTLSATPIPRTLHMSLVGIRDISIIETPPLNRQPIQTFVMSENPKIIREAVLNEVERGGQIFYVYNRVEDIENKYFELKKLLPEVNIAYAHGRMTKQELEYVMTDIINKEYDMLITTTIIETGIDISNVNTLIIEDADRFGLSQLYQIRGRVGRSSRESYAYFMYKAFKSLTENSEKRLAAIKNFTSLGSGFKIAMQDLSIRGAGNVLGGKQHGFIDSVGYTLYSQMLEKEIINKKEILEPILEEDSTKEIEYYQNILKEKKLHKNNELFDIPEEQLEIKLNIDAYLPKEYINNDADKLCFYKSLINADTENLIYDIVDEMIDRFSEFGKEVENLIDISILRIIAKTIKIESIKEVANNVVITFKPEILNQLNGKKFFELMQKYPEAKIIVKNTLIINIENKLHNDLLVKKIIKLLKDISPSLSKGNNHE
ncbi:transcription-repair coupling factor [Gemella sp. zg-1178]|nr:transcription-repair coupling factor [Gemella sp. zg-1178]